MTLPPTTTSRARGFTKKSGVLVIETTVTNALVQSADFSRMLSIMVEGASQEELEAMHRVIARRRQGIHERSMTDGRMGQG